MAEDGHLTQTLAEKMAGVMGRYGRQEERPNAEMCPICGKGVALPLAAEHGQMHAQASQCSICGDAEKLEEHLAHLRAAIEESEAAQAEGFRSMTHAEARTAMGHEHGEPTPEQRVVGDAVRVLINEELDGAVCELVARKFHDAYEALAPVFGYLTRQESAKPWEQVPIRNRALMVAVVNSLIAQGVIRCG